MNPCTFAIISFFTLSLGFAGPALAQKGVRPTGFAGVPFGATPEEAVRILGARPGVVVPAELPTGVQKLELTGGSFAGQDALKWTIEFVDKKLAAASVVIKADANAMALYRELKQNLTSKYGPPTGERKAGVSDADKKNRQHATKQEDTYGNIAYWKFPPSLSDKNAKSVICEVAGPDGNEVTDPAKLQLTILYVDDTLKPATAKAGATSASKSNNPIKPEDL